MTTGTPPGVVAIMVAPDGHVVGSVSDFHPDRVGGCSLLESQRWRAEDKLIRATVRAMANPDLATAISESAQHQAIHSLLSDQGYKRHIIPINHPDEDTGS